MGGEQPSQTEWRGRGPGKVDSLLNEKLEGVEWGDFNLYELFNVKRGQRLVSSNRVSGDRPLITAGFNNSGVACFISNIEQEVFPPETITVDMFGNVFYRDHEYSADDNILILSINDKNNINKSSGLFISSIIRKTLSSKYDYAKQYRLSDFNKTRIKLPVKDGSIDFNFMEAFVREIQQEKTDYVDTYLNEMGLSEKNLSDIEKEALSDFDKWVWSDFRLKDIFNNIEQGKRLKKDDQEKGDIPFVMAGNNDSGISNYISNPVAIFPSNSLTIDIFGNTFYRNYAYGAGDDTGCYWNDEIEYSDNVMLFFSSSIGKLMSGKFDFGNKLRSTRSHNYKIALPEKNGKPDFYKMETLISAIKKKAAMRINF